MTAHTFQNWFLNRFINYLEEGSIISMDNVSYHLVTVNKAPNNSSRKQDITEWLQQRGNYFPQIKPELLE
jgi:predicted O-methyltransferase YrrM